MCGIAGIVDLEGGRPPESALIRRMAAALRHRGPDEFGIYLGARAGLGHARLSIIDLQTGQQPLANEDGSLWIVYNGELFNYIELREELQALGHTFRTSSDTEVIVHAYEQWGEEMLRRFNGQFAIALWDANSRRLFLARDRLGIRPLYYAMQNGRFYFASEVKAIFTDARARSDLHLLDHRAAGHALQGSAGATSGRDVAARCRPSRRTTGIDQRLLEAAIPRAGSRP